MGRTPCCDKENVKRGPWSSEEDAKLKDFIHKYGTGGNWIALPHKAGLKRCGKSCRLRWLNYLRPNIKHGEFTDAEDKIICSFYASIGSRWSIIAAQLPGRTDNDIKNYWNTKLKKKLMSMLPSFQKKPSLFPSVPLQSSSTYNPPLMTSNSSSFYSYTNPNFTNVNNFNSLLTPTTDLSPPLPVPDSNSLISLVSNNAINGENENSFYLGFQEDDYSTYMKEGMLMFGGVAGAGTGGGGGLEVSTTCSSSEGGSYTSQISYGDLSNNHHQIKQEDQFALRSYTINDYKDQKPEGYLRNYETPLLNDLEEVKQLLSHDKNNGYLLDDDDDKNKATHDDHEGICYYY